MSRFISWIIMVPAAMVAVLFAVNNRAVVNIDLWPLPFAARMPLFLIVLGVLVVGFLIGAAVAWLSGGRSRRRARHAESRAANAERELKVAHDRLERAEAAKREADAKGRPALPTASPTSSGGDRAA